jgi:hypothetical protein
MVSILATLFRTFWRPRSYHYRFHAVPSANYDTVRSPGGVDTCHPTDDPFPSSARPLSQQIYSPFLTPPKKPKKDGPPLGEEEMPSSLRIWFQPTPQVRWNGQRKRYRYYRSSPNRSSFFQNNNVLVSLTSYARRHFPVHIRVELSASDPPRGRLLRCRPVYAHPRPTLQTSCQDRALRGLKPLRDTQRSSTPSCSDSFRVRNAA